MSEQIIKPVKTASIDTVEAAKKTVLALQHLIAMFGATVLVPILTGMDISVALFCAGFGTLIFHFCTKRKVPVFLGSSFAFIPAITAVGNLYKDLSYAQGGIIVAGLCYVVMSFVIKKIGVKKITAYFPSQVVGPMIIVIGFNLLPTAVSMASQNYIISAVTLSCALLISFFGKGFFKQLSIITAVAVGYIVSLLLSKVDISTVMNAPWFQIPNFTAPKFDLGAILIITPVVLAVFMEHIGDITTNGAVVGENFIEDPGLNRTLLGDGLATVVAGLLGGPANTTYGENTGVLAITKNYNPQILRIAACFAILLATVGKIGGFLNSIPTAVMGGISVMLFSMIAFIGFKNIHDNKVKFNFVNIVVMATILVVGLGSHIGLDITIPINETATLSGLSLAALFGVILNRILNAGEFRA